MEFSIQVKSSCKSRREEAAVSLTDQSETGCFFACGKTSVNVCNNVDYTSIIVEMFAFYNGDNAMKRGMQT